MADPVYKIVDVVGRSQQSISNAIGNAISKASGTLRNLGWFEVEQIRGDIRDGKVNRYQVTLRVGFTLEEHITSLWLVVALVHGMHGFAAGTLRLVSYTADSLAFLSRGRDGNRALRASDVP